MINEINIKSLNACEKQKTILIFFIFINNIESQAIKWVINEQLH